MTDNGGVMSIDFMVGFTIFILAFIWVAMMIPGLLIGLNAHPVDYDAVAYRTAVILVEDPGATSPSVAGPWEFQQDKRDIIRFGLARSKETPGILDGQKVRKFFCSTAYQYPEDYQQRAIFGDYPYRFNISLRAIGDDDAYFLGDPLPEGYGYIRRDVKIREESNASIGDVMINARGYRNHDNASWNIFSIQFNNTELLKGDLRNPAYQINYYHDQFVVNITDLDKVRDPAPEFLNSRINLTSIRFYQRPLGSSDLSIWPPVNKYYRNLSYIDGNTSPVQLPFEIENNVSLIFEPGFFTTMDPAGTMFINLTFGMEVPQPYLNNTHTLPFEYNYDPANVAQPQLKDAVLEVAVW